MYMHTIRGQPRGSRPTASIVCDTHTQLCVSVCVCGVRLLISRRYIYIHKHTHFDVYKRSCICALLETAWLQRGCSHEAVGMRVSKRRTPQTHTDTHNCTCVYIYMYIHIHTYMFTCKHTPSLGSHEAVVKCDSPNCTHTQARTHTHARVNTSTHVYMYPYICIYM